MGTIRPTMAMRQIDSRIVKIFLVRPVAKNGGELYAEGPNAERHIGTTRGNLPYNRIDPAGGAT